MGYGEAEVIDGDGRVLARASATFIVLPAPGAFIVTRRRPDRGAGRLTSRWVNW